MDFRASVSGVRRARSSRNRTVDGKRAVSSAVRTVIEALESRVMLTVTAPGNLLVSPSAAPGGSPSLLLGWQDNSSDETSFKIKRSTDGTNFSQIGTVSANVAAYSD